MDRPRRDETGFSLIELLVVMIIIAILSSIAIPLFIRQKERSYHSQLDSALKNAATSIEAWGTAHEGDYSLATVPLLEAVEGLKYADPVILVVASSNDQNYCLSGTHVDLGATKYYDSQVGKPDPADCSAKY